MIKIKSRRNNPDKIGLGTILLWGSRGLSLSSHIMVISYLTIFCTNALGLSAALVGTLLAASKVFDGFTDIIAGYIVDKTNTKLGRGRPYEVCIIGVWFCTVLMFACPAGWSKVVKCVWIFVMYALAESIFTTFLNANNTTYMVRAFNNQKKYVSLTTYGAILPMLGAAAINVIFPTLMVKLATDAKGWLQLILIFAIPLALIGMLRFLFIPEKYNVDVTTEKLVLKDVILCLKTNRHIYLVSILVCVYYLVSNMGVNSYYYQYVVGDLSLYSIVSAISMIMLPVMLVIPQLMKKISLKDIIFYGLILCCIGSVVNWFAYKNCIMLIVGAFCTGIGIVPISMLFGLMIIECADYNEWKGIPRMEGTLSVLTGLGAKLGASLGTFLLGICLQFGKFISSENLNVQQPESAILMLRLLISFIPMLIYIIGIVTVRFYTLDKQMPQINMELAERRKKEKMS